MAAVAAGTGHIAAILVGSREASPSRSLLRAVLCVARFCQLGCVRLWRKERTGKRGRNCLTFLVLLLSGTVVSGCCLFGMGCMFDLCLLLWLQCLRRLLAAVGSGRLEHGDVACGSKMG